MAMFQLGFRPFFLAGAAYAAVGVPLWIAALLGYLDWQPHADWLSWHRHEMLFGFGLAIVAGFLLTAVQNWTGRPGLSGPPLMALVLLWLLARLGWLVDAPLWLLLPLDVVFAPVVALVMWRALWPVRQSRNYPIVLVLVLFALASLCSHLGIYWQDMQLHRQGVIAAVWLITALITLIAGRVLPFFTRNGLNLSQTPKPLPWLDHGLLAVTLLLVVLTLAGTTLQPAAWLGGVFFLLAAGHLLRWVRWFKWAVMRVPLLWSLHLAYAWLIVAMLAFALWHLGLISDHSQGLHILTIGTMGGLILAMLARVSLGHTGRPLQPPRLMILAFALVNLAVLFRVVLAAVEPQLGYWLASASWALAFILFVGCYGGMLMQPRLDGRPG